MSSRNPIGSGSDPRGPAVAWTQKNDGEAGLLQRLFRISRSEPGTDAILQARAGLGELGVSIADLNRKIERLERITEKWREREPLEKAIAKK